MEKAVKLRVSILVVAVLFGALLSLVVGMPQQAWAKGEPVSEDPYQDAAKIDLDDGEYVVDVVLEGGSGRASITSPAKLTVVGGYAAAAIEWSSPNYDYMVVDGLQYLPVNPSGNSIFMIPVLAFDEPFDVVGDTTAMSEPHEIEYTLSFSSASIVPFSAQQTTGGQEQSAQGAQDVGGTHEAQNSQDAQGGSSALPIGLGLLIIALVVLASVFLRNRK